jgi:hypothetical protein
VILRYLVNLFRETFQETLTKVSMRRKGPYGRIKSITWTKFANEYEIMYDIKCADRKRGSDTIEVAQ